MPIDESLDHVAHPLGHLLIEFNRLEVELGRLIARLLNQNDDQIIAIIGAQLMFSAKSRLAHALVRAKVDSADQELYLSALVEADSCNTERNGYIHSEYVPYLDEHDQLFEVIRIAHRTRPRLYSGEQNTDRFTPDVVPVDLIALIERVQSVSVDIATLAERYWDTHGTPE